MATKFGGDVAIQKTHAHHSKPRSELFCQNQHIQKHDLMVWVEILQESCNEAIGRRRILWSARKWTF
jgi:hypothetical protein